MRTWSRRGQTPILQYNFNWDTLSAVAGITFYNFYFRLYEGSVKSAEVVDFLAALLRQIAGPLLIVWDGYRLTGAASQETSSPAKEAACGWNTCPATHRN